MGRVGRAASGAMALALLVAACAAQRFEAPEPAGKDTGLVWPVEGPIVSPYRPPTRPSHQGIDLAAPPGTAVVAAESGSVSYTGKIAGYGNVVAIRHSEKLTTVYSHLADGPVAEGSTVSRGDRVGRVGKDGYVHYEIREAREAVDPAGYYASAPRAVQAKTKADVTREPSSFVPITAEARLPGHPGDEIETAKPAPARLTAEPIPPAERNERSSKPAEGTAVKRRPVAATSARNAIPDPSPAAAAPASKKDATTPADRKPAKTAASRKGATTEASAEVAKQMAAAPDEASAPPYESASYDQGPASLTVGVVLANLFYLPAKIAYATLGGATGAMAMVLTGGEVTEVWTESTGGDWILTADHLRGDVPIRFQGGTD